MDVMKNPRATKLPSTRIERAASVTLSTGVTLPYVEQGDPTGLPVVLLHGYTDSWSSWETVLPHLPESMHAFAPTQRGHGDADRPAKGYRIEDFATDLVAFIDALAIGPAVIVGHSLGSAIAQRLAMDHPERTLGFVLVGSVTTWRGKPAIVEFWESAVSTLTDPVDPEFVRAFQESLKAPARIWRDVFQAIMDTDFSVELGEIQAPTLIVWGDQDPLCPASEQGALAAAIADAQLLIYHGGGHNLHWEEPERFAVDLVTFATSLAA